MDGVITIIVLLGLAYSALLIAIGSSVAEDFFLSPSKKRWLLIIMVVVPIVGPIIAKMNTQPLESLKKSDSNGETMTATGSSYNDSGDCSGGSD